MSDVHRNPGYEKYIHSSEWREKADARLNYDRHICRVCGKQASDVHHLTYDRFGKEEMHDLVSLCRECHQKAEEIYDTSRIPWAMEIIKPDGNNFMAAMREDAASVAPIVFEYLKKVRGGDFNSLMGLRQPIDPEGKKYWTVLHNAVDALCRKRYSLNCAADRTDLMVETVSNHVAVICLGQIEHCIRNAVQNELHETVMVDYAILEKWKDVCTALGITNSQLQKFRKDDGTSFGPSLRETVLYYCGLDAAAGIYPVPGFTCLSPEDYKQLTSLADYMNEVSGNGAFKGEYSKEENQNA